MPFHAGVTDPVHAIIVVVVMISLTIRNRQLAHRAIVGWEVRSLTVLALIRAITDSAVVDSSPASGTMTRLIVCVQEESSVTSLTPVLKDTV